MILRLLASLLSLVALAAPAAAANDWLVVDIGIIGAASADILSSAVTQAHDAHSTGIIIRLDTAGGALDSTREMVKDLLGADIPIVVWVGPAGARAASAGSFITLAANVAAMAPGTNIGAAHPVDSTGKNLPKGLGGAIPGSGGDADHSGEDSDMREKITNDTLAFMDSICSARHRNADMARSFIVTSASITDEEALREHVIDLRAATLDDLMASLDGRVVELAGGKALTLATKGATRTEVERSVRQRLLEILSNPNLFYLLFLAGLVGLGYELTHPGIFFPGVAGAICLILALISMSVLPVSYGAVALILVGIALMIAEANLPTFGAVGIGGVVAFVLGSVFLVDPHNTEGLRISFLVIAPGAACAAGAFITLGYLVMRARRAPVRSGKEGIVGERGVALTDFQEGRGTIRVSGAIWNARQTVPQDGVVARGDTVTVKGVNGLELDISKP